MMKMGPLVHIGPNGTLPDRIVPFMLDTEDLDRPIALQKSVFRRPPRKFLS